VYSGIVGLYWAYADDLPAMRALQEPTKRLFTQLARKQQVWPQGAEQLGAADRTQLFDVATQLNGFVGMWAGMQTDKSPAARSPRNLARTLHSDAATRLDAITYECPNYEQTLGSLTQEFTGQDLRNDNNAYNRLSRHFSDSEAAPPVAVVNLELRGQLAALRERYVRICQHTNHWPDADGERLLWEVLGGGGSSAPLSLKEALLGIDDPEERARLQNALTRELQTLTDETLLAQLTKRARAARVGAHAMEAGTQEGEVVFAPVEKVDLWALVDRIHAGGDDGKEALSVLYEQTSPVVYAFLRRRAGTVDDTEDLVSKTYLRAMKALPRLERQGTEVTGWLLTIARNLCTDHFRAPAHRLETLYDEPITSVRDNNIGHTPDSPWLSPEGAVLQAEKRVAVKAALALIESPLQKEVLRLRFLKDLSIAETAQELKTTDAAVKAVTFRALETIRRRIGKPSADS
jgi:RNA polymerase sigma-70 factor (ECF subfamily)